MTEQNILAPDDPRRHDFEALRQSPQIYVDKTAPLFELTRMGCPYMFARPRGFGRTLLLSTMASWFRHGLTYFHGLQFERCFLEYQRQCEAAIAAGKDLYGGRPEPPHDRPILWLDLAALPPCRTPEEYRAELWRLIKRAARDGGLDCSELDEGRGLLPAGFALDQLARRYREFEHRLVLLVDNYDAPVLRALEDAAAAGRQGAYDAMAMGDVTENLFRAVKANSWEFVLITGLTRYTPVSIFSCFNNYRDISSDDRCAVLNGFTPAELAQAYAADLARAGKALGLPVETVLRRLTSQYGGYCFCPRKSSYYGYDLSPVCNPQAVLQFLTHPEEGWRNRFDERGLPPAFLRQLAAGTGDDDLHAALRSGEPMTVYRMLSCDETALFDNDIPRTEKNCTVRPTPFFWQAGYLTYIPGDAEEHSKRLQVPNQEVRAALDAVAGLGAS